MTDTMNIDNIRNWWSSYFEYLDVVTEPGSSHEVLPGTSIDTDLYLPESNAHLIVEWGSQGRFDRRRVAELLAEKLWMNKVAFGPADRAAPMILHGRYDEDSDPDFQRYNFPSVIGIRALGSGYSVGLTCPPCCDTWIFNPLWAERCRSCGTEWGQGQGQQQQIMDTWTQAMAAVNNGIHSGQIPPWPYPPGSWQQSFRARIDRMNDGT